MRSVRRAGARLPRPFEWLALTGYDPLYGARPLRRLVQSAIGDKLAKAVLSGEVVDGDQVKVDLGDDELIIQRA